MYRHGWGRLDWIGLDWVLLKVAYTHTPHTTCDAGYRVKGARCSSLFCGTSRFIGRLPHLVSFDRMRACPRPPSSTAALGMVMVGGVASRDVTWRSTSFELVG